MSTEPNLVQDFREYLKCILKIDQNNQSELLEAFKIQLHNELDFSYLESEPVENLDLEYLSTKKKLIQNLIEALTTLTHQLMKEKDKIDLSLDNYKDRFLQLNKLLTIEYNQLLEHLNKVFQKNAGSAFNTSLIASKDIAKKLIAIIEESSESACGLIDTPEGVCFEKIKKLNKNQYIINKEKMFYWDMMLHELKVISFPLLKEKSWRNFKNELQLKDNHDASSQDLRIITSYTGHTSRLSLSFFVAENITKWNNPKSGGHNKQTSLSFYK
ncbi:hypothetical protein [Legionella pneumophila]|uniref:hypothetical protein n=1 Tax=Legionella pneumophila TaxID=446 RepID=UPI0005C42DDB|nr:hypothetical protein [Legionella pneumophila]GAN31423.1 hypothetical protein lpymt_03043 [Legionella pneumophila]